MDKERAYSIFIDWKAKPLRSTDPKNPDEFCEKYGLEKSDLVDFISRDDFQDRLTTAAINWARGKVPELLHVAFQEAKESKDVAAIERFINIAHDLKKKRDSKDGGNQINFFNITNDQLKQIAARTIGTPIISAGGSQIQAPQLLSGN